MPYFASESSGQQTLITSFVVGSNRTTTGTGASSTIVPLRAGSLNAKRWVMFSALALAICTLLALLRMA